MDHYNIAVCDDQIVTTKGRFGHSRQTHQGTTFVHSSVPGIKVAEVSALKRTTNKVTFLTGVDGRRLPRAARNRIVPKKGNVPKVTNIGTTRRANGTTFSSPGRPGGPPTLKHIQGRLARLSHEFPTWSLYELPRDLPDSSKRFFHICLAYGPLIAYPFYELGILSHNPLQGPETYRTLVQSPATVKFSITLGALYHTILAGRRDSPDMVLLTSQMYSLINEWLQNTEESASVLNMMIHAISILAVVAGYLGNHDHWHIHMRGLVRLIDLAGGQENIDVFSMNGVRKADFVGSTATLTKPYFLWIGSRVRIECSGVIPNIPDVERELKRHLVHCGVDTGVISTLAAVACFHKCIVYARSKKGEVKFDPLTLADHFDCLIHDLLSTPEALCHFDGLVSATTADEPGIHKESINMSIHTVPNAGGGVAKAIESALRILAILFLRDPLVDLPCGEQTMCCQLEKHVRTILANRALQTQPFSSVDSLLLEADMRSWKPTLIWICVAGSLLSIRNGVASGDGLDKLGRPPVYVDLLRSALEPAEAANPELVLEEDLAICRIFDMRTLSGEPLDERLAMRRILGLAKE